ncbi:ABC transporter substrate-binding protein [Lysinibacillus sphaericus]|uniref:Ethanolamine utilization protein EutJ n=3 Tax=Lysinibacillus TaxID=400634 RepID=A0A2S5CUS0_LYSSH|nr:MULTISPECIES: ABC transporter substrate-binding protein [Lysinibacillus]AVK94947.1 ethanolamine utilization protein EutJ [Lysinibacillus sphaericus]MCS1383420.1 ABC transporter substrate-binding protein [Lysinibacillus sphaericus]MED4544225.1 ABC transporter substrate-binding protein [Lysinibacillus sphaericus]OEC00025.1 ethanolamine utilization protein EutJ [Lysinibacillus sphaericus]POZ54564.1 Leucine-, isoleucine-, valine-, threonine-, and alanine-binding protein [Lysinibacillus sphaeric
MKENNKLKKFGSLLVASSLLAGVLAGCGAGDSDTSSGGGSSSGGSKDGDTIKIGANLELSGNVASYGSSIGLGAELAVKEINDAGGIDGKKIELIKVDNKSENSEATAAAIKLATQDKVVAMMSPATSGNTIATVQIANDNKIPLVGAAATAPNVTVNDDGSVNEYAFRTCFIDPFQGIVAANFATGELKAKNVAIFADNASDYAKGLAKSFKDTIAENGGKVVKEEAYVAKDTDFRTQLTNIKSSNPDFIFIPGYYEEVGLIVKQAREMGITVPLMGADGWDSPTLVELAGADALNNTYITNHYSAEDPDQKIQDFVKAFKAANGDKAPDAFNALGYDTVYYIADAIKRAGSTDGEAIKKALAETKDLSLVTGTFSVDENHNPIKTATVLEFKDGKQVFNSKVNP